MYLKNGLFNKKLGFTVLISQPVSVLNITGSYKMCMDIISIIVSVLLGRVRVKPILLEVNLVQ